MRRPRSQNPQLVQFADPLEERAAPDGMQQTRAHVLELAGSGGAAAPAERLGVELERTAWSTERVLLVGEYARREQVQEPVLARVGRIRVVQPRGCLEDDVVLAAAAHEVGELLD